MAGTTLDFLLYLALIGVPFACVIAAICGASELQESLESPMAGVQLYYWLAPIYSHLYSCCRSLLCHPMERLEIISPHSTTS